MSIHSGDIRDQSLKLSEIAPNFRRFSPSQILGVRSPQMLYLNCHACLAARHVEKYREVTPSPQSYRRAYAKFYDNFGMFLVKNCWGPRWGVR